jgi:hypothetical protein
LLEFCNAFCTLKAFVSHGLIRHVFPLAAVNPEPTRRDIPGLTCPTGRTALAGHAKFHGAVRKGFGHALILRRRLAYGKFMAIIPGMKTKKKLSGGARLKRAGYRPFTVGLTKDQYDIVKDAAKKQNRSMSNFTVTVTVEEAERILGVAH